MVDCKQHGYGNFCSGCSLCSPFDSVQSYKWGGRHPSNKKRAYCKIGWLLGIPCDQVNLAIVTQMKAEASYKLVSVTPKLIQANHTSGLNQLESVSFIMRSTTITQGCYLEGTSTSAIWFSLFDDNSNYCSLRNIITGSGLDKASGFLELTNDWLCLGCEQSAC